MIVQWMIRMLVASVLVALCAWSLERVLRAWRLPVRWVWVGGVLMVMLLPWLSWLMARVSLPLVVAAPASLVLELEQGTAAVTPGAVSANAQAILNAVAVTLWVVSGGAALLVYLAGWSRLERARRGWRPARVAGARVLVAPGVGPAAVGVLQPVIVIPDWLLSRDERVRRLVVLHEAEHLRAGDHVLLALVPLAVVLMPWNVALWWMLRELRLAVELDCDGRVLARGVGMAAYGSLLLDVAGNGGTPVLAPGLAMSRTRLERRLVAMLRGRSRWPWVRALPFGAAGIVAAALACETAPEMPLDQSGEPATDVVEKQAARVPGVPLAASPLILIDDVIATQEQMDGLDPKAIERIEVVKGAAAARLMPADARARNGVIMIYMKDTTRPIGIWPEPQRVPEITVPRAAPRAVAPRLPTAATLLQRSTPAPDEMAVTPPPATSIRIREAMSLPANQTPRVFIDGELSAWEKVRELHPDDIQSIEVRKVRLPGEIYVTTRKR